MADRSRGRRLCHGVCPDRLHRRAAGYRVRRGTDPKTLAELRTFSGRTIDVPACFIAGKSDWGSYQTPGVFEAMQTPGVCTQWRGAYLVDGAGHWVQQEQPEAVVKLLVQFIKS
jgi:pimeloyl-ACP methyl ester carboxylesterase